MTSTPHVVAPEVQGQMPQTRSADPHLAEEIPTPREPAHDRAVVLADAGGPPAAIWWWVPARQAWEVDAEHLARVQGRRWWTWGGIVDCALRAQKRLYTRPLEWTPESLGEPTAAVP